MAGTRSLGQLTLDLIARVGGFRRGMSQAEREARRGARGIERTFRNASDSITRRLTAMAGAFSFVAATRAIIRIDDQFTRLEGRLRLVTRGSDELRDVQQALFESAQRTGTAYTDVADLYIRLAQVGSELGATQEQLLRFSEGVGNALRISGTSAQQASGALLQLSQALASGTVRAEEFNSINEGAPEILRTVARNIEGMEGSLGKLRRAVLDGRVSSQNFFLAFLQGTDELQAQAETMESTVSQAWTRLGNTFQQAISQADLSGLVASIDNLSAAIRDEEFQQGFSTFVSGIVNLATAGAQAASNIGNFASAIGEGLAKRLHGSADPLERLRDQIDDTRIAIENIDRRLASGELGNLEERYRAQREELAAQLPLLERALAYEERQLLLRSRMSRIPTTQEPDVPSTPISLDAGGLSDKEIDRFFKTLSRDTVKTNEIISREFEETTEEIGRLHGGWIQVFEQRMEEMSRYTRDTFDEWPVFADQAARNMQDAFADFLFDPFEGGLDGMLKSFIDTLRRMIAEAAAAKIFETIFGKPGDDKDSGASGFLGGLLGGLFGGKRQHGGSVSPGRLYMVGESGPELFAPSQSGTIIPGVATAPSINISTHVDARGASVELVRALPEILRRNNADLEARIVENIRRGNYDLSPE